MAGCGSALLEMHRMTCRCSSICDACCYIKLDFVVFSGAYEDIEWVVGSFQYGGLWFSAAGDASNDDTAVVVAVVVESK